MTCSNCKQPYNKHSHVGEWCPPNLNGETIEQHDARRNLERIARRNSGLKGARE